MVIETTILTADEAWVALALLHRRHPDRDGFSAKEIMESAKVEKAHPELRPGLQAHIYLHNVANVAPNSARYRMFYKVGGGKYRLYRPGDDCHADRKGKITPKREDLPAEYHHLLNWYEKDYSRPAKPSPDDEDPVLQMWGVGKEIWANESGDAFITRERQGWDNEMDGKRMNGSDTTGALQERIWGRIVEHQGVEFRTTTSLPFTHSVRGNGIWIDREGKPINQRLGRGDVNRAILICPVSQPIEFREFRNPSYLFGLLMDPRIRSTDW